MKNLRTMMLSPVLGLAVSMVPALAIAKDAAVVAVAPAPASSAPYGVGMRSVTWIDTSRGIKKSMGFEGSDTRRIDVTIWYPTSAKRGAPENDAPAAGDGPWPLVIYAHGTMGYPSNNMNTVNELVSNGYVVVAPTFPLSSRAAFTHIKFADVSDLRQQVGDVSFLIDKTLADPMLSKIVNPQEIGFIGHSLGGVTGYFATYGGG
ncbi:chlorophyllase/cutinase-like alpha/beta fold protein, partial [Novosphingobium pentaromativorans]